MVKESTCKSNNKNNKRKQELANKKKKDESSESDEYSSESDEEELKAYEYRNLLAKMFPSKYIDKKIAADEKLKKAIKQKLSSKKQDNSKYKPNKSNKKHHNKNEDESEEESESEEEEEKENVVISKNLKIAKSKGKKSLKVEEDDEDEDEDDEDDDDEEDDDADEDLHKTRSGKKFNIVFTIGNVNDEEEWETDEDEDYDYDDEDEEDDEEENEDEDVSEDETEEDNTEEDSAEEENTNSEVSTPIKEKMNDKITKSSKEVMLKENNELLISLNALQSQNYSDVVQKCVKTCENNIKEIKKKQEKCLKKQKDKNGRIFKKQLREKNTMNDFAFFNKLEIEQQKKIIKELREINTLTRVEKPYRLTLLESTMPNIFKAAAMKRINALKYMEQGSGEFYKIKNWVDTFMKIPFGVYEKLPINISNGVDSCHDFMENALTKLDDAVYGLNDAKMQIMQMLGQLISNPNSIGGSVALKGPPGTGKTSLIKEGISKILNRPFAFIALGGATDSSFLEGHSYTYEGSTWGKIVQIIIDSKCMNPVIYFDELDKISDTPKGEEIAGILTHLTDSTQNSQFHDKYFSEVDFDLSKCLFIFSYNDETKISPILRDRMYKIQTKGYDKKQKTIIANQYLLPKIIEQVKFDEGSIIILEDALHYIIDNHCAKEEGVRNLKRCLEIIYTKLNLYRLMKPNTNLFEQEISLKVEFPFTVTKAIVDKLIKPNSEPETWRNLYN